MKHIENFGKWYDPILNLWPFCLDDTSIKSNGLAWGFKENGKWNFLPRITGNSHQYFNALLFVRLGLPLGIFVGFRLSETHLGQIGIGWKLSGRFAIHFRFQTDASSAIGFHPGLPNTDQASGFNYGGH